MPTVYSIAFNNARKSYKTNLRQLRGMGIIPCITRTAHITILNHDTPNTRATQRRPPRQPYEQSQRLSRNSNLYHVDLFIGIWQENSITRLFITRSDPISLPPEKPYCPNRQHIRRRFTIYLFPLIKLSHRILPHPKIQRHLPIPPLLNSRLKLLCHLPNDFLMLLTLPPCFPRLSPSPQSAWQTN